MHDQPVDAIAASRPVVDDLLRRWELRAVGAPRSGEAGVVVPVRTVEGDDAALKVQAPGPELIAAARGLAAWDGRGMVRLLRSDVDRGALLLERLQDRDLHSLGDDDEATRIAGELLVRLHSTAPPAGLAQLDDVVRAMIQDAPAAAQRLADRDDGARLLRWAASVDEVRADRGEQRMLHWDLHFGNVLAATREPWLGIDPEPLVGDPGFDLWPILDSGWGDAPSVDAPGTVRRRFDLLTASIGLDRDRARRWTLARLLQNTLWAIGDGEQRVPLAARVVDDALL